MIHRKRMFAAVGFVAVAALILLALRAGTDLSGVWVLPGSGTQFIVQDRDGELSGLGSWGNGVPIQVTGRRDGAETILHVRSVSGSSWTAALTGEVARGEEWQLRLRRADGTEAQYHLVRSGTLLTRDEVRKLVGDTAATLEQRLEAIRARRDGR